MFDQRYKGPPKNPDEVPPCGACHVAKAIELGVFGVLLASGGVKPERPYEALAALRSGLR